MFLLFDHFDICEIEVFDANMSSKYIANLTASNVILTGCANTVLLL